MRISTVINSRAVTDRSMITIANSWKVACDLTCGIRILTLVHSKGEGQVHAHFDCEYLANGYRLGKCCCRQQIESRTTALPLTYMQLTLANSKGQDKKG